MSKTLIMIPTYNEKENLKGLIAEIFRYANDINILVVDDSSPDGTGDIADNIASEDERVSVLRRTSKRGRGYAGVDAFKEALRRDSISYILEMDADFSHDPRYIPEFLKEIRKNDIVIGSRFIKGGKDTDRSILRNILSKAVNFFIKKYLRINIKDCSSGYRCFRRHVIESLDLDSIVSKGPAIIEETLYVSTLKKYKIKEIPIAFKDRYKGCTKLSFVKLLKVLLDILIFKYLHLNGAADKTMKELRKFGFSLAMALNLMGAILFYRGKGHFVWFTGIGSFNLILAILCPGALFSLKKMLDFIIFSISRLVNFISLAIVFYLIFSPIGLLLRLFRKDLLCQRIDKVAASYWIKRKDNISSANSYERMG